MIRRRAVNRLACLAFFLVFAVAGTDAPAIAQSASLSDNELAQFNTSARALVYALMAFMVGVVYRSEFLWAGLGIWAAAIVAMFLPDYNGFIVGPAMGLGMIVPGVMAERRVRRMRAEEADVAQEVRAAGE